MRCKVRVARLVGVIVLLAVVVAGSATAAKPGGVGSLDPGFGHGGKVFAKAPKGIASAAFGAAVLQGDGDLVVELNRETPAAEGEGSIREIERRRPDGSLDPSFGKEGKLRVGAGKGLALRSDGSILVGTSSCGPKHGSILVLDPNGNRATGFGEGGCGPAVGFEPGYIVPGPDGATYLGGSAAICPCGKDWVPRYEPVVAQIDPSGSLDGGFGKGGVVHLHADLSIPLETLETREANGIVPSAGGGVVVATGNLLVGLGPTGSIAADFGKGGQVELSAFARALTQLPGGKLVVAESTARWSYQEPGRIVLTRYLPGGAPDPGFGDGGKLEPAPLAEATPIGLAPAPDEAALVAGEIGPAKDCREQCHRDLFVAKVAANGQLDGDYGKGGVAELPFPPVETHIQFAGFGALSVAAAGESIVTGGEFTSGGYAIATNPAGAPETGFGEGGTVVEQHLIPPYLEASGIALGPRGRITVGAEGTSGSADFGGFLIGFGRSGQQSRGAAGSGVTPTEARGELVATRGGFVSKWEQGEVESELVAVRPNGLPMGGFGHRGISELPKGFEPRTIDPGPGGGTIALGSVDGGEAMAVYRVGPRGRPVAGFGRRGLVKIGFGKDGATAFAATSVAGGIIVTGWVDDHTGAAKLLPSGRLDRRFGHGGLVRGLLGRGDYGSRITALRGGVIIGATAEIGPPIFAGVVRLDSRGRPVRRFGQKGVVHPRIDGRLVALFVHRGRIVVVSDNEYAKRSPGGVELRAYRANGSPDLTFGKRGLATGGVAQNRFFHPVAAAQQPDGKIVVAGTAWGGPSQVELLRFR